MHSRAEAAARERRRYRELQKQSQIFDARVRTIGIDKEALDAQVKDKKIEEAIQKAHDDSIAAEMKQNDKILCMLDQRQKRDTQILNKAINEFRQNYQKPETVREYDLFDPLLQKDTAARLADSDPRCTISSLQKFMGEDLNSKNRWRLELDEKAMNLQRADEETRRAICITTTEFNQALAAESERKRRLEKQQEEEANERDILSQLQGDLLSENPQQAVSSFGPNGIITDRWKGMSQAQLKEIRDIQLQQVLEKLRLDEEELQRNAEWERKRIQEARAELLYDRHQQRQNRDLRRALDNFNVQLSQEQKNKQAYMNEEVYTNFPSGQYYSQFNTLAR
ncbi:RIB43A-like with coiled-coils protein 2, partial [Ophiophagus hannah]